MVNNHSDLSPPNRSGCGTLPNGQTFMATQKWGVIQTTDWDDPPSSIEGGQSLNAFDSPNILHLHKLSGYGLCKERLTPKNSFIRYLYLVPPNFRYQKTKLVLRSQLSFFLSLCSFRCRIFGSQLGLELAPLRLTDTVTWVPTRERKMNYYQLDTNDL